MPDLIELVALVGEPKASESLKLFIQKYNFRQGIKDKDSWASSYGIFLNAGEESGCRVGFCPEQFDLNKGLAVELPFKLSAKDKISDVVKKFGKPDKTFQDPDTYYEMHYGDFKVTFLRGVMSEIWLIPKSMPNHNRK